MNRRLTLILVLSSLSPCFAHGIPCERIEIEKLREMEKEALAMTFCDYKSRSDANQDAIRSFDDFSFMDDARSCMEEMLKAGRVYRDRFGEEPPDCGQ